MKESCCNYRWLIHYWNQLKSSKLFLGISWSNADRHHSAQAPLSFYLIYISSLNAAAPSHSQNIYKNILIKNRPFSRQELLPASFQRRGCCKVCLGHMPSQLFLLCHYFSRLDCHFQNLQGIPALVALKNPHYHSHQARRPPRFSSCHPLKGARIFFHRTGHAFIEKAREARRKSSFKFPAEISSRKELGMAGMFDV